MAIYKAGELTKENILNVSRELFYLNGFENTTYIQISKKANVNLGTIVYHFKSLEGIAKVIYDEIVIERANLVNESIKNAFPDDNFNKSVMSLAQYRINTQSYLDYPNYARFITEQLFKSEILENPSFETSLINLINDYDIKPSKQEYAFHKYLFLPYAALITSSVNSKFLEASAKDLCDYQFHIRLKSIGIDDKTINQLIDSVDRIASKIRITIDKYMFVSININ